MPEPHVFRMPSLGADMTEGTVLEWLVQPGEVVRRGDLVAVVKTDKADVEIEVFENGTIGELIVPVGETVEVGEPLAMIVSDSVATPPPATAESPTAAAAATATPAPIPTPVPVPPAPAPVERPVEQPSPPSDDRGERLIATPYARRRAAELGVDLAAVSIDRPGHPITASDVERAARSKADVRPVDQAAAMRAAIAKLMARSKREIPHYYLEDDVDLTHALRWLSTANESRPVEGRLLPAALFCKAVAVAARHAGSLNGFWMDNAFVPAEHVHLGIAIALRGGGLVAPAVHDADELSLAEIMSAMRELTTRARGGRLRASEMTDATLTVTMLGDQGVRSVFGVIYPPQVALVGFGRVIERVFDANGGFGLRSVVNVTLSADHRATDGHIGARFLTDIRRRLQHPEDLA